MIEFENVSKTYNGKSMPVHALQGVNLQIVEGEFAAVMDPSGSGRARCSPCSVL